MPTDCPFALDALLNETIKIDALLARLRQPEG
jgi:hypothetical protein